ncbi:MAG: hypothetical protein WCJ56_15935, partial [bacterium]
VDTPGEVYINMQQIDAGPNYRWGRAGDGGNGCLYYYATGKRYTSHGGEDVGDASKTDTEATTSFGVWRDQSTGISRFKAAGQREPDRKDREGMFYSIGLNELTEPFYPFQIAQRSRLLANPAYAGPDYRARTGILVGGDYLILHDEITNPQAEGRFSWSIADSDEFPVIQQLRPGVNFTESAQPGNPAKNVPGYKRRYYTSKGDFLTFVSHKAGYKATAQPWGVEVSYDGGRDLIFQSLTPVTYQDKRVQFTGTSAVVRLPKDGKPQVAIYGAGTLTVDGFTITTTGDAGVSATITDADTAGGETFAQAGGTFSVASMTERFVPLWLDGKEVKEGQITVTPGKHIWQRDFTAIPSRPAPRTVSVLPNDVYRLNGPDTPGATSYRLERLVEGAWQPFTAPAITAEGLELQLKEPGKLVLRLVAIRSVPGQQTRESAPSAPFAVYVDKLPCRAPDGLKINLYSEQGPNIIWGQVQGVAKYLLERRTRGTDTWAKVYEGSATAFTDTNAPTRAQYDAAGGDKLPVYEYRISAANGNGSTANPLIRSSDPKDYLNIDPLPGDGFRRQVETYECYGEGAYDPWREEYQPILAPYPR